MSRTENEATLRWLEGAREAARREGRWRVFELLDVLCEEVAFEVELAGRRPSEGLATRSSAGDGYAVRP